MKKYFPDEKNNVCVEDANGISPQMRCSCREECEYICKRLNEGDEYDRQSSDKKDIHQRSKNTDK